MEELIFDVFQAALPSFFRREEKSISSNVSERNLCQRLSFYMERQLEQTELKGYYVDTEYNRKQEGQVKTIINAKEVVVNVTCDLLVHSRGEIIKHDNLLALEMKKSTASLADKSADKERLCALTSIPYESVWSWEGKAHPEHVCGYKVGIYMEINKRGRTCYYERYRYGKFYHKWSSSY